MEPDFLDSRPSSSAGMPQPGNTPSPTQGPSPTDDIGAGLVTNAQKPGRMETPVERFEMNEMDDLGVPNSVFQESQA